MADIRHEILLYAVHLKQTLIAGFRFSARRNGFFVKAAVFQGQSQLLGQSRQQSQVFGIVFTPRVLGAKANHAPYFALIYQRHNELGVAALKNPQQKFSFVAKLWIRRRLIAGNPPVSPVVEYCFHRHSLPSQPIRYYRRGPAYRRQQFACMFGLIEHAHISDRQSVDNPLDKTIRQCRASIECAQKQTDFGLNLSRIIILSIDITVDHALQPTQQRIENRNDQDRKKDRDQRIFRVLTGPRRH